MEKEKSFQTIVLAIFIVVGIIAVAIFALQRADGEADPIPLTIWGELDEITFRDLLSSVQFAGATETFSPFEIEYFEVPEERFESILVDRLAEGRGPDVILVPHQKLIALETKLTPIPYDVLPERAFRDTYVLASEILLAPSGVLGVPLAVDPLIMYWNRDIVSSAGYANPPRFWEELQSFTEDVTQRDQSRSVRVSAVPFGEYANVDHAKELFSTLLLQAGTSIIEYGSQGLPRVDFAEQHGLPQRPAEATLRFFTEYADPSSTLFTWDRARPNSRQAFLSGDLALYFGPSGERDRVRAGNPNLNIDTAPVPQIKDSTAKAVFGDVYAFAIISRSRVPNEALRAIQGLAGKNASERLSTITGFAPVRKDVVSVPQEDPFAETIYDASVLARAWVDINEEETDRIFRDMVENVTSGRLRISESVTRATDELKKLVQ